MSLNPPFSLSVVSHGQAAMIAHLLDDLKKTDHSKFELLITINIPEDDTAYANLPFATRIIRNASPKGFGANHNAAFAKASGQYLVIVNPDIRLPALNLDALIKPLEDTGVGAVAPVVLNSDGAVEDSARRFPTVLGILRRTILRQRSRDYEWNTQPVVVDWTGGMFVVFRRRAFEDVGGFDDRRFFMYLEDTDICRRLRAKGWSVMLQPGTSVIHDAQRASRRSLRHLRWHVTSFFRYFTGL